MLQCCSAWQIRLHVFQQSAQEQSLVEYSPQQNLKFADRHSCHDLSSHPMSAGFGFSTGDFIAALELVSTVLNALRESGGSSTEYQALISQLYTLETALLRVKRLDLDDVQHAEAIALRQAASQCQRTIDAFLAKIAKYQPSLRAGGSGNTVRDTWRKVKWALCRKEDVVRLRADLLAHTESIDMLLMTVHMWVS